MAPPTNGDCDGVIGFQIDEGHYGDVNLDGVIVAVAFYFPRAIHHGGGHMQPIFRPETTEAQREAMFAVMSGEGQPAGTMFQIFSTIIETIHTPQFLPIEFEWDVAKRRGRIHVPDFLSATTEPIRNPVTNEEVQIRTVLPDGWVFYEAEVGSGTAKSTGDIKFDYSQRHSSLATFAFNNNGMAHTYEEAKEMYGLDNAR
jgi:hypothetical protein|tara:strand:- start:1264 stop:1863 length:600 start_codon:yes stop_codon:yes gene_type:complete